MICNLTTDLVNGIPALPPMSSGSGYCLHHTDEGSTLRGGFSLLGEPDADNRVRVQVELSADVYTLMLADENLPITDAEVITA